MTSKLRSQLVFKGQLILAGPLADYVKGNGNDGNPSWDCWLSDISPLWKFKQERERIVYAQWLDDIEIQRKGLYLWLQPRPGNLSAYRFVHVGISAEKNSTLVARTKRHCGNQFSVDRVCRLQEGCNGFGSLGDDQRNSSNKIEIANEFMRNLKILFLCNSSSHPSSPAQLRRLEGLVAYAGADAFGENETTNTLSKTTRPSDETFYHSIRVEMNKILEIFPYFPVHGDSRS
ncbi:hypothetical protein [Paraburkholderia flagellata]|uniref:hypothetical protein n=1 Tax=Paraburkholderia flagellata TaxID=2883241 RepID=UPI001F2FA88A|nr:hypothetical protein [Paraburkholderia flagellata]